MEGREEGSKTSEIPPVSKAFYVQFPPATTFLTRNDHPHFIHMEIKDYTAPKHWSQNCSDSLPNVGKKHCTSYPFKISLKKKMS